MNFEEASNEKLHQHFVLINELMDFQCFKSEVVNMSTIPFVSKNSHWVSIQSSESLVYFLFMS